MATRASRRWLWPAVLLAGVVAVWLAWGLTHVAALPAKPVTSVAAAQILTQPIADTVPNAAQIRRGQYLVRVGDCLSCHLRAGGRAFAGGLGLNTPFGVIYSSNITSDPRVGIGGWTSEQFYAAMHRGVDDDGNHLYPAFPYPWFTRISRADDDAILAYLKTVPPGARYAAGQRPAVSARSPGRRRRLEPRQLRAVRVPAGPGEIARVEPRRGDRHRTRPLRRVPHAQDRARGRPGGPCLRGRRAGKRPCPRPDGQSPDRARRMERRRHRRVPPHRPQRPRRRRQFDGRGDHLFDRADDRRRPAGDRDLPEVAARAARRGDRGASGRRDAAWRGALFRRLLGVPSREWPRPATVLPAAAARRDAATG